MEIDSIQLSSLGQQYVKVEKETHKAAQELERIRKKRRLLEAEVRFLQEKVRFFRSNADHDRPSATADHQHQVLKTEEPQFFEVEVKFADSLDSGFLDTSVFDYPSSPQDLRNEYVPRVYSR